MASNPETSKEVLDYLIDSRNLRPVLLSALLENPSVTEESVSKLAASISRGQVDTLVKSKRISRSREILGRICFQPKSHWNSIADIEERIASLATPPCDERSASKGRGEHDRSAE